MDDAVLLGGGLVMCLLVFLCCCSSVMVAVGAYIYVAEDEDGENTEEDT